MFWGFLVILLDAFLGISAQTIHQWPSTRVQRVGSPLSLKCSVKGTSNPNMYWYRQASGGAPQRLFVSFSKNQVESEAPQHLVATRPEDDKFSLTSEKLLLNDSGVYLCAWSLTLSWER